MVQIAVGFSDDIAILFINEACFASHSAGAVFYYFTYIFYRACILKAPASNNSSSLFQGHINSVSHFNLPFPFL